MVQADEEEGKSPVEQAAIDQGAHAESSKESKKAHKQVDPFLHLWLLGWRVSRCETDAFHTRHMANVAVCLGFAGDAAPPWRRGQQIH